MEREHFDRVAKALADARRFEILEILAGQPCIRCSDVIERVGLSQPTISHHLKELANAGIITVEKQGATNRYHVEHEVLAAFCAFLSERTDPNSAKSREHIDTNQYS
jgi:ArsR family transcriptional regulator